MSRRGHDVHDLRCRTRGSGHALGRGLHNIHLARRAILREKTDGLDRWISLGRDKLVRRLQDDDSGQLDRRRQRLARREQHPAFQCFHPRPLQPARPWQSTRNPSSPRLSRSLGPWPSSWSCHLRSPNSWCRPEADRATLSPCKIVAETNPP